MHRRTAQLLGRPKGPPGLRPGKEHQLTIPFRTEATMLRLCNKKCFNTNIRELFKKPLVQNNIKAIPRDLGELPRNYVLKLLYFHQPVRLIELWEACKQHDDVPLDSAKHLRLVLKIAKLQKWVYAEKNQTNNLYYYYIHQSRAHEVQSMIRADEVSQKRREAEEEATTAQRAVEEREHAAQCLDENIIALQNLLAHNISMIQNFDPAYVAARPYVTEGGTLNYVWHWDGTAREKTAKQDEAGGAGQHA